MSGQGSSKPRKRGDKAGSQAIAPKHLGAMVGKGSTAIAMSKQKNKILKPGKNLSKPSYRRVLRSDKNNNATVLRPNDPTVIIMMGKYLLISESATRS